jgi:CRP/FNR family transcriptional regulator
MPTPCRKEATAMIEVKDLKTVLLFSGLRLSTLEAIRGLVLERGFAQDEVIFLQDEPCDALYVVKAGKVRLYRLSPEGKEQTLCIKKPGECFCPVPILDGDTHLATAVAMTKVSVYMIYKMDLLAFHQDHPEVMSSIQSACVKEWPSGPVPVPP